MAYDAELERFKQINLVEYLVSLGWSVDRRKSTSRSCLLKKGKDKVVVSRDNDGHYIWFDVYTGNGGTIIDFLRWRKNLTLGQVRKELRGFQSLDHHRLEKLSRDTMSVERVKARMTESFLKLKPLDDRYLKRRGITIAKLDKRFENIRTDERGNVCFPHYIEGGVVGWEMKNRGFTGYSKGGMKVGVYTTTNFKRAKRVVIVESGIDALSHAQLHQTDEETAYISLGGSLTHRQIELLQTILDGKEIIVATDNDPAGNQIAHRLAQSFNIKRETPTQKDWNDELQYLQRG